MNYAPVVTDLHYRKPREADATAIWRIARDSRVLDLNSPYCYMLLCRDYTDTCVVAEAGPRLVGFATAYIPPRQRDTVFVWQVGVAKALRGQGIGAGMLEQLLVRGACMGTTHLETTITPSNKPSLALFQGFARQMRVNMAEVPGFGPDLFPDKGHEPEQRYRIGPFPIPLTV
ncbi:MAG: diaminobutyrate acetyltransferase [Leptospirillia bacterium]